MQGQAAADEVRFLSVCLLRAAQAWDPEPPGAFTRGRPYMPLCTRSEVYIRLVCPGIGLSQGAATTRRQGAGPKSHNHTVLVVVNLLSFESHMSGSHLSCQECGCLLVSLQAASPRDNPATWARGGEPGTQPRFTSTKFRLLVLFASGDSASNAHLRDTTD